MARSSRDGGLLTGTWTQSGQAQSIAFHRKPCTPAAHPSAVDGIWLGTYPLPENKTARLQLLVRGDAQGREYCTMDALDIYSPDFECTKVAFTNDHFDFDIPAGGLHWSSLSGTRIETLCAER